MYPESESYLLPCLYLGPISYYSKLARGNSCCIELFEHFQKQTYRNRCVIADSNGKRNLIIPLKKHGEKELTKDILISYDAPWQRLHWKTIESAYRSSPYFEYFEDDFRGFYLEKKFKYLIELNLSMQEVILRILKLKTTITLSESFEKNSENIIDLRNFFSPKKGNQEITKSYPQVFDSKFGFIAGLSVVDLLFNEGNRTIDYL